MGLIKRKHGNAIDCQNSVVKIDTEGLERQVLSGGAGFFTSINRPVILLETFRGKGSRKNNDKDVLALLAGWGYEVYAISDYKPGVPAIYPAFAWGRFKRSWTGNYIAFHERHHELASWCKAPEPPSVFMSSRRLDRLMDFQQKTIDSMNAYRASMNCP